MAKPIKIETSAPKYGIKVGKTSYSLERNKGILPNNGHIEAAKNIAKNAKEESIARVYGITSNKTSRSLEVNGKNIVIPKVDHTSDSNTRATNMVYSAIEKLQIAAEHGDLSEMQKKAVKGYGGEYKDGKLVFDENKINDSIKSHATRFQYNKQASVKKSEIETLTKDYQSKKNELVEKYFDNPSSVDAATTSKIDIHAKNRIAIHSEIDSIKNSITHLETTQQADPTNPNLKARLTELNNKLKAQEQKLHENNNNILDVLKGTSGYEDIDKTNQAYNTNKTKLQGELQNTEFARDGKQAEIATQFGSKKREKKVETTPKEEKKTEGTKPTESNKSEAELPGDLYLKITRHGNKVSDEVIKAKYKVGDKEVQLFDEKGNLTQNLTNEQWEQVSTQIDQVIEKNTTPMERVINRAKDVRSKKDPDKTSLSAATLKTAVGAVLGFSLISVVGNIWNSIFGNNNQPQQQPR